MQTIFAYPERRAFNVKVQLEKYAAAKQYEPLQVAEYETNVKDRLAKRQ